MVFIEWWLVRRFVCALLIIAAGIGLFCSVRRQKWTLRIPVHIVSLPLTLIGLLFVALQWVGAGCISYSAAIYSPDHREAARLRIANDGAVGGSSTVELFEDHGWREEDVFWGDWMSVTPNGVIWVDSSHLRIEYDNVADHRCETSSRVIVECVPRLEPAR